MAQNETAAAAAAAVVRTEKVEEGNPFWESMWVTGGWADGVGVVMWWRRRNNDVSANEVSDGITAAAVAAHVICRMCSRVVCKNTVISTLPIVIIAVITGRTWVDNRQSCPGQGETVPVTGPEQRRRDWPWLNCWHKRLNLFLKTITKDILDYFYIRRTCFF